MTWKLFEKRKRSPYRKLENEMIAIISGNAIVLTPKAYAAIGKPSHVNLLSDEQGRIGIRAADKDDPGAFEIRKSRLSMVKVISKNFLLQNFPDHEDDIYFDVFMEGNVLVLDTKGEVYSLK